MTENKNRCVITGLGMVCAIGNSVEETWNNAIKGVSGIKNTQTVDTEGCYATLAAEVHDNTLANAVTTSNCSASNGNSATLACCTVHCPAAMAPALTFRAFSTLTAE